MLQWQVCPYLQRKGWEAHLHVYFLINNPCDTVPQYSEAILQPVNAMEQSSTLYSNLDALYPLLVRVSVVPPALSGTTVAARNIEPVPTAPRNAQNRPAKSKTGKQCLVLVWYFTTSTSVQTRSKLASIVDAASPSTCAAVQVLFMIHSQAARTWA